MNMLAITDILMIVKYPSKKFRKNSKHQIVIILAFFIAACLIKNFNFNLINFVLRVEEGYCQPISKDAALFLIFIV